MRLTSHEIEAIAAAFVAARREARALVDFPVRLPEVLDDSVAVQEAALRLTGERIAGWKVAMVPPALRVPLAAERLAGPVDATTLTTCLAHATVEVAVHADGFAAVEAEFVVVIGREPKPGPDGFTADGVRDAVASIHAGVEVASSPLPSLNDLGPLAVVCDHGNNAGVVVGPEISGWRDRPPTILTTRTRVAGRPVGEGSAASVPGGPLGAVAWLAGHLAGRGRRLAAGDIVSTGMTTGVHVVRPGQSARVDFAFAGGFDLTVVASRPQRSQEAI
ncbi:MAG: fumarylacetoacetate hydrolase family protein [Siculibacillus sp.]|nr:fumarylacetoacetate hydrolase family protein [Siculibacillus sp.]